MRSWKRPCGIEGEDGDAGELQALFAAGRALMIASPSLLRWRTQKPPVPAGRIRVRENLGLELAHAPADVAETGL